MKKRRLTRSPGCGGFSLRVPALAITLALVCAAAGAQTASPTTNAGANLKGHEPPLLLSPASGNDEKSRAVGESKASPEKTGDSPKTPALPTFSALSTPTRFTYPAALPPEAAVRRVLEALPELQTARAGINVSIAERQRLESGPYEWSVRGEAARRRVRYEKNFQDYEVSVDRPLRWFGKAAKDEALGKQAVVLSNAFYADTWHEAGRALLAAWFGLLREERVAWRMNEQVALSGKLLEGMQKRVRAGDVPKMELMLAQTEHQRLIVVQQQAAQRAQLARIALERKYPGLPLPGAAELSSGPAALSPLSPLSPHSPIPAHVERTDWGERIAAANHEHEQATMQVEQKKLLVERSSLERMPDPTVGVRYTSERDGEDKIVGLSVSIPLPGEARRAGHAGALAELDQARQEEMRIRNKVDREARQLLVQAASAKKIAATLETVSNEARQNAALVAKAYALGESAFADTLLANRQALEAAQASESAHIDALESYSRLLLDSHQIWSLEEEKEEISKSE